jgi:tRNA(Arg) A34 adenosine deaminase TadA/predicted enzyme related to lactoylglutathione lyase
MSRSRVRQLRVVLRTEDFDAAVAFYRDTLGMVETPLTAGPDGARIALLEAGRATLELVDPAQARYIDTVETAREPATPVRLAFEVPDAADAAGTLGATGAQVLATPTRTPWGSLNARLAGPGGVHVTVFSDAGGPVGATLSSLGGEPGALAHAVDAARAAGTAGQLPFAALVARDGVVIGAGVNTASADADPSAHAEVTAIRDAGRRTGSGDLAGAVVYSSCEPCAICRAVAAAAGVTEIVFAAGRELVPAAIDPAPEATARLTDAVTAVLPGIARRGATALAEADLAAPFRAYLGAVAP